MSNPTSNSVFRENRWPPPPHPTPPWIFSFSIAVTLKIRSGSPKSNQSFLMSQLHIHENLVRIQPLVHKILCRQESVMPKLKPMGSAPKTICPPPLRWGDTKTGSLGNLDFSRSISCSLKWGLFTLISWHRSHMYVIFPCQHSYYV